MYGSFEGWLQSNGYPWETYEESRERYERLYGEDEPEVELTDTPAYTFEPEVEEEEEDWGFLDAISDTGEFIGDTWTGMTGRGLDQLQGSMGTILADQVAGNLPESLQEYEQPLTELGNEIYYRNLKEAEAYGPRKPSRAEQNRLDDPNYQKALTKEEFIKQNPDHWKSKMYGHFPAWLPSWEKFKETAPTGEELGEMIPSSILPSIAGRVAGGVVGSVAGPAGTYAGQMAGGASASSLMTAAEVSREIRDNPTVRKILGLDPNVTFQEDSYENKNRMNKLAKMVAKNSFANRITSSGIPEMAGYMAFGRGLGGVMSRALVDVGGGTASELLDIDMSRRSVVESVVAFAEMEGNPLSEQQVAQLNQTLYEIGPKKREIFAQAFIAELALGAPGSMIEMGLETTRDHRVDEIDTDTAEMEKKQKELEEGDEKRLEIVGGAFMEIQALYDGKEETGEEQAYELYKTINKENRKQNALSDLLQKKRYADIYKSFLERDNAEAMAKENEKTAQEVEDEVTKADEDLTKDQETDEKNFDAEVTEEARDQDNAEKTLDKDMKTVETEVEAAVDDQVKVQETVEKAEEATEKTKAKEKETKKKADAADKKKKTTTKKTEPKAKAPTIEEEVVELLQSVEEGGAPSVITANLKRIAKAVGVPISKSDKPIDVVNNIKAKAMEDVKPKKTAAKKTEAKKTETVEPTTVVEPTPVETTAPKTLIDRYNHALRNPKGELRITMPETNRNKDKTIKDVLIEWEDGRDTFTRAELQELGAIQKKGDRESYVANTKLKSEPTAEVKVEITEEGKKSRKKLLQETLEKTKAEKEKTPRPVAEYVAKGIKEWKKKNPKATTKQIEEQELEIGKEFLNKEKTKKLDTTIEKEVKEAEAKVKARKEGTPVEADVDGTVLSSATGKTRKKSSIKLKRTDAPGISKEGVQSGIETFKKNSNKKIKDMNITALSKDDDADVETVRGIYNAEYDARGLDPAGKDEWVNNNVKALFDGTEGFVDNRTGNVYMVADNIKAINKDTSAIDRLAQVLFHETIGHVGLRAFLGAQFDTFINRFLKTNKKLLKRWATEGTGQVYLPTEIRGKELKVRQKGYDKLSSDEKFTIAEEYIAQHFAEHGARDPNLIDRIAVHIARALNKQGLYENVTTTEVKMTLAEVQQEYIGGNRNFITGENFRKVPLFIHHDDEKLEGETGDVEGTVEGIREAGLLSEEELAEHLASNPYTETEVEVEPDGETVSKSVRVPKKTVKKVYKLMEIRDGQLFYPFVEAKGKEKLKGKPQYPVSLGEWQNASFVLPKDMPGRGRGMGLAPRGGFHLTENLTPHLMTKLKDGTTRVWVEVEIGDDTNFQDRTGEFGNNTEFLLKRDKEGNVKNGKVPEGGQYRFRRPAREGGWWRIAGEMRLLRILPESESTTLLNEYVTSKPYTDALARSKSKQVKEPITLSGISKSIKLYHGSPKRFNKFVMDHVGHGVRGWGLYFADFKALAKIYSEPKGYLYDVNVAPKMGEFLDLNKSFKEQSEYIRTILKKIAPGTSDGQWHILNSTGDTVYSWAEKRFGSPKEASLYLSKVGIKGHKSRTTSFTGKGQLKSNIFVVYNPDDVLIKTVTDEKKGTVETAEGRMLSSISKSKALGLYAKYNKDAGIDGTLLLHKNTRPAEGKYRITFFREDGELDTLRTVEGHEHFPTLAKAKARLSEVGNEIQDITGGRAIKGVSKSVRKTFRDEKTDSTMDWVQDRGMRGAELDQEYLDVELRWLKAQEEKKKLKGISKSVRKTYQDERTDSTIDLIQDRGMRGAELDREYLDVELRWLREQEAKGKGNIKRQLEKSKLNFSKRLRNNEIYQGTIIRDKLILDMKNIKGLSAADIKKITSGNGPFIFMWDRMRGDGFYKTPSGVKIPLQGGMSNSYLTYNMLAGIVGSSTSAGTITEVVTARVKESNGYGIVGLMSPSGHGSNITFFKIYTQVIRDVLGMEGARRIALENKFSKLIEEGSKSFKKPFKTAEETRGTRGDQRSNNVLKKILNAKTPKEKYKIFEEQGRELTFDVRKVIFTALGGANSAKELGIPSFNKMLSDTIDPEFGPKKGQTWAAFETAGTYTGDLVQVMKFNKDKPLSTAQAEGLAKKHAHLSYDVSFMGEVVGRFKKWVPLLDATGEFFNTYLSTTGKKIPLPLRQGTTMMKIPVVPLKEKFLKKYSGPVEVKETRGKTLTYEQFPPDIMLEVNKKVRTKQALNASKRLVSQSVNFSNSRAENYNRTRIASKGRGPLAGLARKLTRRLISQGTLEDFELYKTLRRKTKGTIHKLEQTGDKFYKIIKNSTQQKEIYDYLTTVNADKTKITDEHERQIVVQVKKEIMENGRRLVEEHHLMTQKTLNRLDDQYLPRKYLKYLLRDKDYNLLNSSDGNLGNLDLSYLNKRQDIEKGVRELILGEVKDPAFLATTAFATPRKDMALLDFMESIATEGMKEGRGWVLPKTLVTFDTMGLMKQLAGESTETRNLIDELELMNTKGVKVSGHWLVNESERIQNMTKHMELTPQKTLLVKKLTDRMADAGKGLVGDILPKEYMRVPKGRKYGKLQGMAIRKEIFEDLFGWSTGAGGQTFNINDDGTMDRNMAEKILGTGGTFEQYNRFWKWSKVSANPPSWVRNFVSNLIFMNMGPVPLHRMPDLFIRSLTDQISTRLKQRSGDKNNEVYDEAGNPLTDTARADGMGLTSGGFSQVELKMIKSNFEEAVRRGDPQEGIAGIMTIRNAFKGVGREETIGGKTKEVLKAGIAEPFKKYLQRPTSDLYGGIDSLGKIMMIKYLYSDKAKKPKWEGGDRHYTLEEAAAEAEKWLFDYSNPLPSVKYLRKSAFGAPFLSYPSFVAPLLIETILTKPWKFVPHLLFGEAMLLGFKSFEDISDEEYEAIVDETSSYIKGKAKGGNLDKFPGTNTPWIPRSIIPVFNPFSKEKNLDENGRVQLLQIGYLQPWGMFSDIFRQLDPTKKEGIEPAQALHTFGMLSSPLMNIATTILTNRDPFTDREIYDEFATGGEKLAAWGHYMWNLSMPPMVHGMSQVGEGKGFGALTRLVEHYNFTVTKEGEEKHTKSQALWRMVGINITPIAPHEARAKNVKFEVGKINRLKRRIKKNAEDAYFNGMSIEDIKGMIRKDGEKLKALYEGIKDKLDKPLPAKLKRTERQRIKIMNEFLKKRKAG